MNGNKAGTLPSQLLLFFSINSHLNFSLANHLTFKTLHTDEY